MREGERGRQRGTERDRNINRDRQRIRIMDPKPQTSRAQDEDGREKTSRWSSKLEFFMAAISSTVGLGNLWRFPYVAYRNGGGKYVAGI